MIHEYIFSFFLFFHSDSIAHHAELLHKSYHQKPDRILRKRKKYSKLFPETLQTLKNGNEQMLHTEMSLVKPQGTNPLVKVAVWTMTVSMGVMTMLVLNTGKYWM